MAVAAAIAQGAMTTDRAPNTRAEEAAAVWSAAPKQFDKALLKVIACWDDALQRMRPDNEHAFVALIMPVSLMSLRAIWETRRCGGSGFQFKHLR